jgi:regulator of sigma E protease
MTNLRFLLFTVAGGFLLVYLFGAPVLIFLAVLFLLVLVHEWGHYITAKLTGMRVDEFGIGFPPKLFGIKRGETEYTFNALPIGGFVKIYGEDGVGDPSARLAENISEQREGNIPASGQPRYEEDADAVVEGSDFKRSFTGKNKWAQALVLVAGVSMNVLFAWFLFSGAFMWGVERAVEEGEASPSARLIVTEVMKDGPADDAKFPVGGTITAVTRGDESLTTLTPSSFAEFVSRESDTPVQIAYTRGSELFVTSISPEAGIIETEPDRPVIGVALALVDRVQYPFFVAVKKGFTHTLDSTKSVVLGLGKLFKDAVVGEADFSQVAGPIGIVGLVGDASAFGFSALLMFTAFISLNLAVINLLPFPALDGGRLLFVGIEAVTRRSIPARATQIMNTVGFFLLIGLMLIVTWNDIARLL